MNAADRIALVDRLARGLVWRALSESEQAAARDQADGLVSEIEISRAQVDRIGWILVDPSELEEAES